MARRYFHDVKSACPKTTSQMRKIKVCFLIPSLKSGGIETYLLRFLKEQKDVIIATVLVRNNSSGELYDDYLDTNAKIVFKPLGYFSLSALIWYYKFFMNQKYDTICDFNANFAGLPMLLAKLAGVEKRISFYRQGSNHFKMNSFKTLYNYLMNRLVYKYSTAIFANSSAGLEFFFPKEYLIDDRFKVIRNGIKIEDYLKNNNEKKVLRKKLDLPEDKFIIGHTGRYTAAKNHEYFLKVAKKLVMEDQNLHFVLIGYDTTLLLPFIQQLELEDYFTVLEFKRNIPEYLAAFDLYFFPSVTEGQPNALIEAMVAGLPIVASDIPSIKECFEKDRKNCLIDPYDENSAIEKIRVVKESPHHYTNQTFAVAHFNANIQFAEFKNNL